MSQFRIEFVPFECPFCDHKSTFKTLREWTVANDAYLIMCCPNPECSRKVFVHYDVLEAKIINIYPKSVPECDERIPEKIRNDFLEAKRCLGAKAYKGTVVMCRRALQNSAIKKGAKKKYLFDQLNELGSKKTISKELQRLGHSIRSIGKYGAHPKEDELDKVTEGDAKEILDFLGYFLEYVFVMPKRVEELESKSKKKKV